MDQAIDWTCLDYNKVVEKMKVCEIMNLKSCCNSATDIMCDIASIYQKYGQDVNVHFAADDLIEIQTQIGNLVRKYFVNIKDDNAGFDTLIINMPAINIACAKLLTDISSFLTGLVRRTAEHDIVYSHDELLFMIGRDIWMVGQYAGYTCNQTTK